MSDTSPNLNLPYILPAQAQKHVTHNEALDILDAIVQVAVMGRDVNDPPATPQSGETWAIGDAPTGLWALHAHMLASFNNNGWVFVPLREGLLVWDMSAPGLFVRSGGAWVDAINAAGGAEVFGVNSAADSTNRLSVAGDATLLTHDGGGHQLKLNKATAVDTATLLFQSGFSGRAEIGLAGEDDLSIKVSEDGTNWVEALRFDGATGAATGAAVQANKADTAAGALARADFVYGPGNLLGAVAMASGAPDGAVMERSTSASGDVVKWADGTMICTFGALDLTQADADHLTGAWTFPDAFSTTPCVTFTLPAVSGWTDVTPAQVCVLTQAATVTGATATLHRVAGGAALPATAQLAGLIAIAIGRWV